MHDELYFDFSQSIEQIRRRAAGVRSRCCQWQCRKCEWRCSCSLRRIRFCVLSARACGHCACACAEEVMSERRSAAERRRSEGRALRESGGEGGCVQAALSSPRCGSGEREAADPSLRICGSRNVSLHFSFAAAIFFFLCFAEWAKRQRRTFSARAQKNKKNRHSSEREKARDARKEALHTSGQESSHARLQLSLLRLIEKGRREIDSRSFSFAVHGKGPLSLKTQLRNKE